MSFVIIIWIGKCLLVLCFPQCFTALLLFLIFSLLSICLYWFPFHNFIFPLINQSYLADFLIPSPAASSYLHIRYFNSFCLLFLPVSLWQIIPCKNWTTWVITASLKHTSSYLHCIGLSKLQTKTVCLWRINLLNHQSMPVFLVISISFFQFNQTFTFCECMCVYDCKYIQ